MARIIELKQRHPFWGAPKLRQKLKEHSGEDTPAESTVSAVLKRRGLTRPLDRRRKATPSTQPLAHAENPNDVWSVDLKGDFALGDGTRCYPLTVCDALSRYFLGIEGYSRFPPQRASAAGLHRDLPGIWVAQGDPQRQRDAFCQQRAGRADAVVGLVGAFRYSPGTH